MTTFRHLPTVMALTRATPPNSNNWARHTVTQYLMRHLTQTGWQVPETGNGSAVSRQLEAKSGEQARLVGEVVLLVGLHLLEQLEAPGREVRVEVRGMPPADRVDLARVDARGLGRDVATFKEQDAPAQRGEMKSGGGPCDPATHDHDLGVHRAHGAAARVAQPAAGARPAARMLSTSACARLRSVLVMCAVIRLRVAEVR